MDNLYFVGDTEFDALCFDYGLELDEVVSKCKLLYYCYSSKSL